MKIAIDGQFDEKADYKLKLIKSSGSFSLVATNKSGKQHTLVQVDDEGDVIKCWDSVKEAFK